MTLEIAYDPCYNDHVLSSNFVTLILRLKNFHFCLLLVSNHKCYMLHVYKL